MFTGVEDSISIEEVVRICNSTKDENMEFNEQSEKNAAFMNKYELLENDIKNYIRELEKKDYHSGPIADYNKKYIYPLWIFIKKIKELDINILIYIKLKIINCGRKIIIISFHEEGLHNED